MPEDGTMDEFGDVELSPAEEAVLGLGLDLVAAKKHSASLEDMLLDYIDSDCGDCTSFGNDVRVRLWNAVRNVESADTYDDEKRRIVLAEAEKYRK